MKHAIGGFAAGMLLAGVIDGLVTCAMKKSTTNGTKFALTWGVLGGLAAWGLM